MFSFKAAVEQGLKLFKSAISELGVEVIDKKGDQGVFMTQEFIDLRAVTMGYRLKFRTSIGYFQPNANTADVIQKFQDIRVLFLNSKRLHQLNFGASMSDLVGLHLLNIREKTARKFASQVTPKQISNLGETALDYLADAPFMIEGSTAKDLKLVLAAAQGSAEKKIKTESESCKL